MTAPLKGFRVVELSTMITAPLAGMMLADMGAEVVKIERLQPAFLFLQPQQAQRRPRSAIRGGQDRPDRAA